jgi:hypothetical protein
MLNYRIISIARIFLMKYTDCPIQIKTKKKSKNTSGIFAFLKLNFNKF